MFAALLSGEVKMSAEKRLTIFNDAPDNDIEASNEEVNEVKKNMKKLLMLQLKERVWKILDVIWICVICFERL